jgi:hypothetical protein
MRTKRLIVLGTSVIMGAVLTWLTIYVGFGTDIWKFAPSNVALLFLSLASAIGIWLDYLLDTKLLKS